MEYIIIKAKDIRGGYKRPYDTVAICGDIIINCAHIKRIESYINKNPLERPDFSVLVLYMADGVKYNIDDDMQIETNWDLIMCYHRKSKRIEL